MIFHRLPGEYPGFAAVRDFVGRGDLRLLNLEIAIHRHETFGAAVSGGSWFCAQPEVPEDVRAIGFNALSTANNQAMDYIHAGLLKTLEYIRGAGFACAGASINASDGCLNFVADMLADLIGLAIPAGQCQQSIGKPKLTASHEKNCKRDLQGVPLWTEDVH